MNALRTLVASLLVVLATGIGAPAGAADANPAASAFMQSLGSRAIAELTDATVPQPEREARFRNLLRQHFDMAALSKFVLGRYWRTASEAERSEFQQLFEDFIVQSYAVRFSGYNGQAFLVSGSVNDKDGAVIVHSKIDMPKSEDIRVDWRLRAAGDGFAIVDIIVEGVSLAVTQRSEFASVIQSRGGKVAGLLEALRSKNAQSADNSVAH
jgi:phospholipid transport system substrate-binding protein